ncbi:hypothetical protein [Paractinoplanes brasiliensis]|uniref:Uncharacterized protein n=1 Tax=Paractinoplanes brasiliensis TaxID=52695 RepID=A0A4R6J9B7_9ACTN|nr:hypothetical protein [Actinoplanes brasiliensis]TDO31491.1 hypothetical protein C8E87_6915 [Actinoplanes brasiliensis]GID30887.1 hypothetical protein Abr02nite_58700 [Actinoplanes brasiliensis]
MKVSVAHKSHMVTYLVLGVAFLLLTGVALFAFTAGDDSENAQAKAERLSAELTSAGLRAPATDQIVRVLGDDGGAVCADPGNALRRSTLYGMLTNGAAGPGQRPIIAGNGVMQGQLLIMKVYCPQHLDRMREVVDDLKTGGGDA